MKWKRINFQTYETNDFVIWLFVLIISIVLLFNITDPLFKYIFLALSIILIVFGLNETIKKINKREYIKPIKKTQALKTTFYKNNLLFSFWVFGVIFVLFSLFLLFFYNELLINQILYNTLPIIAPIFMVFGFFIFFVGRFGKIQEIGDFERFSKYIETIGIGLVVFGIFFYSYYLLAELKALFEISFYIVLVFGVSLLLIEEILEKNKYSSILLNILLVAIVILLAIDLFDPNFFFYDLGSSSSFIELSHLTIIGVFELISQIGLLVFSITGLFYVIFYELSKISKDEKKRTKELLKDIILVSFFIWILGLTLFAMFSFSLS
jgi:hypothetical protein